jgi:glycosyltransferase involved in cell wall biosynthesis
LTAAGQGAGNTLLVLITDRLSDLVAKGEVTERYYNPGELFDEVHIAMLNDDRPDPAAIQPMVGAARLHLHNIDMGGGLFKRSLGYRPRLLRSWAQQAVDLARTVKPRLVRTHQPHLNSYAALRIKQELGIPYVVSLHLNPDEDLRGRARGWRERLGAHATVAIERAGLRGADLVLPVYEPILPYVHRLGVERYEVAYNVLNATNLRPKTDYELHRPVRIVSVGRQFAEKDPSNLIRAVAQLPGVRLDVIGDGVAHAKLRALVAAEGLGDRVELIPAMPNDELCRRLPEYDLFAVHTEFWEISKSVLEALLTGLPVVINRRRGAPVPELTPDICRLVDNTPESYRSAIETLIDDDEARRALGERAHAVAHERWSPERTEARFEAIYRRLIGS